MDTLLPLFARRLKGFREGKGWTQYRLAKEIGTGSSQIWHYEKGNRDPSLINLVKIAEALEVSIDNLIGRTPP